MCEFALVNLQSFTLIELYFFTSVDILKISNP